MLNIWGSVSQPKTDFGRTATNCWRIFELWVSSGIRVHIQHENALGKLPFIRKVRGLQDIIVQTGDDNVCGMVRQDLYCWNWFAVQSGTNNDLKILSISPLLLDIFDGTFKIRTDTTYNIPPYVKDMYWIYVIADRIFPNWPIF